MDCFLLLQCRAYTAQKKFTICLVLPFCGTKTYSTVICSVCLVLLQSCRTVTALPVHLNNNEQAVIQYHKNQISISDLSGRGYSWNLFIASTLSCFVLIVILKCNDSITYPRILLKTSTLNMLITVKFSIFSFMTNLFLYKLFSLTKIFNI